MSGFRKHNTHNTKSIDYFVQKRRRYKGWIKDFLYTNIDETYILYGESINQIRQTKSLSKILFFQINFIRFLGKLDEITIIESRYLLLSTKKS